MTWEETIIKIRTQPEFNDLVRLAYFDEDLALNVDRFSKSEEFAETLELIKKFQPNAKTILDIGSGNGISAVNFALKGFHVASLEPDPSNTVGYGAICALKEQFQLASLEVHNDFAENLALPSNSFDVVYVRQAMHHANHLQNFIKEAVRVLKPGGLLLTIRDHVVFNDSDKQAFLKAHALHKFYGGENAFSPSEYREAIENAGAVIKQELKYYDSIINYFPTNTSDITHKVNKRNNGLRIHLRGKISKLADIPIVFDLYKRIKKIDVRDVLDETKIPGRMYSYVAIKK